MGTGQKKLYEYQVPGKFSIKPMLTNNRKDFLIDVQYKPQLPTMKPNKAQGEVSCYSDGNPEPTIMWSLPDGGVFQGSTVKMQVC